MNRILVISPHPDDESIGCGGTLRCHIVQGDQVQVVFLTSGEAGGHARGPAETGPMREREAAAAAQILGLTKIEFWHEPDGALRSNQRLIARLHRKIAQWKPSRLYVPHDHEMHPDHRAAARAVRLAVSNSGPRHKRPEVLLFEVWTAMEKFDRIVDISPYVEVKMAAIRAHKTQCDAMQFDDAFLGLARYRGEMHSWPEGEYAEAFRIMRI